MLYVLSNMACIYGTEMGILDSSVLRKPGLNLNLSCKS